MPTHHDHEIKILSDSKEKIQHSWNAEVRSVGGLSIHFDQQNAAKVTLCQFPEPALCCWQFFCCLLFGTMTLGSIVFKLTVLWQQHTSALANSPRGAQPSGRPCSQGNLHVSETISIPHPSSSAVKFYKWPETMPRGEEWLSWAAWIPDSPNCKLE